MTQSAIPAPFSLFLRSCVVTVGTIQVSNVGLQSGLDIWFKIKRTLKPGESSTCDLKLTNLADATRQTIESYTKASVPTGAPPGATPTSIVPVTIAAGYVGNSSTIFAGQMRSAQTVQNDADFITELNTGDGDEAKLLARSTASFGTGANAYVVAVKLMNDMGCGFGNLASVASILRAAPLFSAGCVIKGNSNSILSDVATACGLEVSIQGGVAQWLTQGQPLGGQAYLLSSNTGMIGSPTVDTKGILHVETVLLPGLAPGQPIQVNAKFVQGLFRIRDIETTADTSTENWGHSLECARIGLGVG